MGGGAVLERVASTVSRPVGSDMHPDLVLMWQALLDGWVPPMTVSRELYYELKAAEPSPLRGFAGFGCSFGGRWFEGYATARGDDYCGQSRRAVLRKAEAMRDAGVRVVQRDYVDLDPGPGALIYCDPPYAGTTPYSELPPFDTAAFWSRAREWAAAGCVVLVSEYTAPDDVPCIWERPAKVSLRRDNNALPATERLFVLAGAAMAGASSAGR